MFSVDIGEITSSSLKTVRTALDYIQEALTAAGVPEPEADAQVLVAHVLGVDRLNLFLDMDRFLTSAEEETLAGLIRERTKRKPLQHILGEQEFWSLSFKVTSGVLIPRPETEILVEAVLSTVKKQGIPPDDLTILDLCTGSGILAVVLARELPGADIYAVDISKEALSVAMENARRHEVSDPITFLQGDLFAPLADQGVSFDLIVSNPPYIPGEMFPGLSPEVRDYEPRLALDGGPDGLDVIRKIIIQSVAHLKVGGRLFLEIGDGQGVEVLKEIERRKALGNVSIIRDYCGIDRVIRAQRIN
ncbi:MAG: peptide chain release factor N(5)-glutamine methyltransferase [Deltaproteobacteria bacterium]|nr:peptide chain release factor N(5)-glutamine methyltransferase [Deltaproteobacteria bacterium]